TTEGDLTGMTASGTTTTCTGTPNDDVWYSFVATAPTHRIQILNIDPTTAMNHSLFTGTCDGTLTLVAGSCATATTSNPTGLIVGQTYLVRVHSAGSTSVTTTFDVCVSAPPEVDMQALALFAPGTPSCYGANETVTITIKNNSWLPIDFSVDPTTVTATATGGYTSSVILNTGTLAAGATMNVTMPATIDMSAAGAYTFNASTSTVDDGNTANDAMPAVTRTRVAPVALPISNNFNTFTGSNLNTVTPGWTEANGATVPTGTTSNWVSSATAQTTLFGSTTARVVMNTTGLRNEWILTPKFVAQPGAVLTYTIALTQALGSVNSPPINANGTHGMQGTNDEVIIRGSIDCGATWFNIYSMNASNTVGLTNVMQSRSVDLTAYAGQELILGFYALRTSSSTNSTTSGAYDFHLDNVVIQVGDVCSGAPVAGTATSSVAGPVCSPASTSLSVSGQSNIGGIVINWYSSTTPGGPFTAIAGANTNPYTVQGLSQTTYFLAWVKCALTNDSVATNVVSTTVTPTPTASASNDGPVCAGGDIQLTGTTDIGTTFQWTGPNGFSSALQSPTITDISVSGNGTYNFVASANGCSSAPATTVVSVNDAPGQPTVTPGDTTICAGQSVELVASGADIETFGTATLSGTSPTTATGAYNPYYRLYENMRTQYVIRATELNNLNIDQLLTSIAFQVTVAPTPNNMINYTIKLGQTSAMDATTVYSGPLTTVYGPVSYSPVVGTNTHVFNAPFTWDGTSNLVIDICFENDPNNTCTNVGSSCWGNTPTVSMATAAFTGSWYTRADNIGQCNVLTSTATGTLRPVMTFGYGADLPATYSWSPAEGLNTTSGDTVQASPTTTTTYIVTGTLPNGCSSSTDVTVTIDTTDTDSDGIADCFDECPLIAGEVGGTCDPGPGFENGVITAACACEGTPVGDVDCMGVANGPAMPGTP
ncbi:MAG: hypothetical protein M3R08_07995, partial [Bacteroidota bacterium]|nr:hypothetical protein [Bacteroidota bacterium]